MIVAGLFIGVSYYQSITKPVDMIKVPEKGTLLLDLGEYAAAAGATSWLEIYAYPHTETANTTFAENTSATLESASLAYADTDGWSDDLVANTEFDIVVRVRYNATHAWNSTLGDWDWNRTRCNITISGDETLTAELMYRVPTDDNQPQANFLYENFWLNKSDGTGFQIGPDGTITVSKIYIWAKY